ncbi:MAG: hypothetical protein F6K11_36485, partial [Leptolyngbya sp. SIO3F4]|nr:hypothetical protein [Leptolyngbya sp. SIO3F4]
MGLLPVQAMPALSTTPTIDAGQLDLDGEGSASTHVVKVADIAISTDSGSGLTLTISSGDIDRVDSQPISFQITTVADNAAPPNSGDFSTLSGNNYTYTTNSAGAENRDVYIRYTPRAFQDPGN